MAARAAMLESRQSPQELQSIMAEARVAAQTSAQQTNGHMAGNHCSWQRAEATPVDAASHCGRLGLNDIAR